MIRIKCLQGWALGSILVVGCFAVVHGQNSNQENSRPDNSDQDAKRIVQQAVKTELAANSSDQSRWLYYEVNQKPKNSVTQWVAETSQGDLRRTLKQNGQEFPADQQHKKMDSFIHDSGAQAQQRKAGQHDDRQATELLKLLPDAFIWTSTGSHDGNTTLHFKPDAKFHPPNREARVFAAMEGDMRVNDAQHRIVSLKGRLIRDVKFGGGLLATLRAGGTFDVERREIGQKLWQITETHVHIDGHALFFKSISEQEDDVKTSFTRLPDNISFQQAEELLLKQNK
jgi:hypothetical protein